MRSVGKWRDLKGRTVVITGASAGVGRAVAHRFARGGARVGLIARDRQALMDVNDEIRKFGGRTAIVAADVADASAVFSAAEQIERMLGPIDIWINNAMVTVFSPVSDISPDEFRRVTEVTYLGVVHGTMAALQHMRSRNRGTIIQVGSALAYRGIPLQAAYCGAKHAIRGFTNSLRSELIHTGSLIKIAIVELPAVNTPQFDWARTHMPRRPRPVPPVIQPQVVANTIYRAALQPWREYWIGWSTLKVILGNMILPGLLDRYLARKAFDSQETELPVLPGRKDNLFEPVHGLHRIRGSFGNEASTHAIVAPGPVARLTPVVLGAAIFMLLGFLAGHATQRRVADSNYRGSLHGRSIWSI